MLRTSCVLAENDSKNQPIEWGRVQKYSHNKQVKVRRQSWEKGRCEGAFWKPIKRREAQQILLAAKRYELLSRKPGKRNGSLGTVALEILELFISLVDHKTGRLDPSIQTIMRYIKRSKDAVTRALKALRTAGFLNWLRSYTPDYQPERGPQIKQASNAYKFCMPAFAQRLLGYAKIEVPLADDIEWHINERAKKLETYRNSLGFEEKVLFDVGENPLGKALARLAKSIKERESAKRAGYQSI